MATALFLNIIIVLGTVFVVLRYCRTDDGKHTWERGSWKFRFFTTDSNVFSGIAALIMIPFEIRALASGGSIPLVPLMIKYMATVAVSLTFVTVLFFLGPTQGYKEMYSGTSFFVHFLGPVLAFISFCFLERGINLSSFSFIFGMIPMVLYAILYYRMVLVKGPLNGGWEDFYGFNVKDRWKISLAIMLIATLILSIAVLMIHNR